MPTYTYKCNDCETKFEYFFKTKESSEDVNCPSCNSASYRKVMSMTNMSMSTVSSSLPQMPSCATGGCQGGSCSLN